MPDLAQRVQHVRLLLETLNDPLPAPRGALRTDAGPSRSHYVPCETCRREGWVRRRSGWILCLVCDGRGWKAWETGEEEWDAYMELPLEEAGQLPREPNPVSLARVEEEIAERETGSVRPYGWERLRASYDRHGSYGELRRCLGWLSLAHPRRHSLVRAVLVDHEPRRLGPVAVLELELGVLMIALRMRTVRVPPWLIERTEADARRESIAELAAQGLRAGEIARRLGLPKSVVRRKLKAWPSAVAV